MGYMCCLRNYGSLEMRCGRRRRCRPAEQLTRKVEEVKFSLEKLVLLFDCGRFCNKWIG